jgi:serine/threonine-protein kinase
LTGRRPFESDNWMAAAGQRLAREPEPLAAARPDVPEGIGGVAARALRREPAARHASAAAFREALLREADAAGVLRRSTNHPSDPTDTTLVMAPIAVSPVKRPNRWGRWVTRRPSGARLQAYWGDVRSGTQARMGLVAAGLRDLAGRIRRMDRRSQAIGAAMAAAGALIVALLLPGALNPPRAIAVADLAGKDLGTARELVRQAGAALRVAEAASDTVPKGQVLRQEPPPNTQFMSNRPLTVVVSSGPPPVKVPDLRNRRAEDARTDLEAAGLSLGKLTERQTTRQPWGAVLGQSARAGSTLPPGTVVDVIVSAPPYTTVPGLGGKAIGDAEAELERSGLRLGEVRQDAVAGRRAGTVTGQDPAAGVRLRQGDAVAVTIAVPPAAPKP